VQLEFLDPGADEREGEGGAMSPSGARTDWLDVPAVGKIEVTLINAGLPTIFVDAASLGLRGVELQGDVNGNAELLARAEAIQAHGAVARGLVKSAAEATATRPHTPKLAFVAKPQTYRASDGKMISADSIDLLARIFSMGQLHHAMTGTGAVAISAAAAIPGTMVHRMGAAGANGRVRFGLPSGSLNVGAEAQEIDDQWVVSKALMSPSARRLMEGWVRIPSG
jgi:2-methylaconitate cis-trans-isomerase PrpF